MEQDELNNTNARRVIKKGNRYLCGICGRTHLFRKLAESCVDACLSKENADKNISEQSKKTKKKYRCSYCKRVYIVVAEAKECVRQCKEKANQKHAIEKKFSIQSVVPSSEKAKQLAELAKNMAMQVENQKITTGKVVKRGNSFICKTCNSVFSSQVLAFQCYERHVNNPRTESYLDRIAKAQKNIAQKGLSDLDDVNRGSQAILSASAAQTKQRALGAVSEDQTDEASKYQKVGNSFICHKCKARYESRKDVIACYNLHAMEDRNQRSLAVAATSEKVNDQSSSENNDSKFFRDGSKYVCSHCKVSYFSKAEVVQCFDGHGGSDSLDDDDETVESGVSEQGRKHRKVASNIPDKDKFIRSSAKYACKRCGEKYFTKLEVIQCFDKHESE